MALTALTPQLHRLRVGPFQAYLWRDRDAAVLIDTGAVGSGPAITAMLTEVGLRITDLDLLVLTHFHHDHTGSAAELVGDTGVPVLAGAGDADIIRGLRPGPPPVFTAAERALHARVAAGLPPAPPVRVDRELHDGDVLDFGGGARVVGTPGHTDGSLAVHLPAHRVLFTGDIAAEFGGRVVRGVFHLDRAAAAASFDRLAALDDVDIACFGHGEPARSDAGACLRTAAAVPPED